MQISNLQSVVNRIARAILILAILRYAVYGLILGFEFARRGLDGAITKLGHLTFMFTWRIGFMPPVWVEGAFALGTFVLALIYFKTRSRYPAPVASRKS